MLVRINATSRHLVDGHLAAFAGERAFCSEFKNIVKGGRFSARESRQNTSTKSALGQCELTSCSQTVVARSLRSTCREICLGLRMVQLIASLPKRLLRPGFA